MKGTVFKTRQEVIDTANKSLLQFDAKFWKAGFDKLIPRYRKSIALNGENVEPDDSSDDTSDNHNDSDL